MGTLQVKKTLGRFQMLDYDEKNTGEKHSSLLQIYIKNGKGNVPGCLLEEKVSTLIFEISTFERKLKT